MPAPTPFMSKTNHSTTTTAHTLERERERELVIFARIEEKSRHEMRALLNNFD